MTCKDCNYYTGSVCYLLSVFVDGWEYYLDVEEDFYCNKFEKEEE